MENVEIIDMDSPEWIARIQGRVAACCPNTLAQSLAPFKSHGERKRARRASPWIDANAVRALLARHPA